MPLGNIYPTVSSTVDCGKGAKSLNLNIFSISDSIWFKLNPVGATNDCAENSWLISALSGVVTGGLIY